MMNILTEDMLVSEHELNKSKNTLLQSIYLNNLKEKIWT